MGYPSQYATSDHRTDHRQAQWHLLVHYILISTCDEFDALAYMIVWY